MRKVENSELLIVGLYEYNDVYQVVDSTDSVLFQGSKADCKKYVLIHRLAAIRC